MVSDLFLLVLALILAGYALIGRSFAYLGVRPLFIGELTLLLGVVGATTTRTLGRLLRQPTVGVLAALMLWCATRTIPYVARYGVDALRDGALWGYGVFTFTVAAVIIARHDRLNKLVGWYRRFVPVFLVVAPVLFVAAQSGLDRLMLPGTKVPLLDPKAGDLQVHLAGLMAFGALGVGRLGVIGWSLAFLAFVVAAPGNRAGMLSVVVAMLAVVALRPWNRKIWQVGAVAMLAAMMFLILNPHISLGRREISRDQLVANVRSIVSSNENTGNLQNTKVWRLAWWGTIVQYTVFGPYFWQGKGFGVNLADDDGFQVIQEGEPLRSPHNGHLTFLARAGVPGFMLWILVQATWGAMLLAAIRRARRSGAHDSERLLSFLLAYWLAFLTNASFDVFLEGPMGGIWFWSLLGIGIAAVVSLRDQQREQQHSGSAAVTPVRGTVP